MDRRLTACAALATLIASAHPRTSAPSAPVSAASFLSHVRYLASDDLGGRGNGTPGLDRAGDYIASLFMSGGLAPAGDHQSFFQAFDGDMRVEPPASSSLVVHSDHGDEALALGDQYFPLSIIDRTHGEPAPSVDRLPVVFAGYGITAPAFDYDDYAGLDVAGKAVFVFTHEPQEDEETSVFNGRALTPGGVIATKAREAARRGAALLIVADDPAHHVDYSVIRSWWNDPQSDEFAIPVLRVARARIARSMGGIDFDRIARRIDQTLVPESRAIPGVTVSYTEYRAHLRPRLRNVVGLVRGSDPARPGEAIVVGAHYDHLGIGGRFSEAPDQTGTTHNGADDNASGTAAMIELCRAAAALRPHLPITLVCVGFAGEEIGLLGSDYYVTHPSIPLDQTQAMINLDMVGRARGRVMVGIFGDQNALKDLRRQMQPWTRLTIDDFSHGGYEADASDESSFAARGIPSIAFFTGFHADYHLPGDDWQKIDAEGGARIADLALRLVTTLAR